MPIVFVCSEPFGGGERLARTLAEKLGYAFLSRDDIVARANEAGIPVGKLEVAMVKRPAVQERMARLKERYLALATATIAERAAENDLVYYGRAGHMLLPGVSHVLRVRVIPEAHQRLETAMQRIKLPQEKAEKFLHDIDSDIRGWVHFVHGVEMDDLRRYDVVINLENVSIPNAAAALCGIAELPDFRVTPASRRAMEERLLQSRARIRLALDDRTANADLTVRSSEGTVTITYVPRQASVAPIIPEVLRGLPGCREIRCTVASTNILWVAEDFQPDSAAFHHVSELARRLGAAVELLRFRTTGTPECRGDEVPEPGVTGPGMAPGGVEEDIPESIVPEDRGFRATIEALVSAGRSGGAQTVVGAPDRLSDAVNPNIQYSLVAVGDVCLHKPAAVRTRLARDLQALLAHRLKAPVVSTSELQERLHFGRGQIFKLVAGVAGVAVLYWIVFTHQEPLLNILGGPAHQAQPWTALVVVSLLAPLVAGLYGVVASLILKLIRLE